jgi:hypothetical protein
MKPTSRRWLRIGAFAAFGIATLVGWLGAGVIVLFSFAVTPNPGHAIEVGILQALSLIGWLAIVAWLVVDLGRGKPRFVLAPFAAWLWVYLVAIFLGNIASLGTGI